MYRLQLVVRALWNRKKHIMSLPLIVATGGLLALGGVLRVNAAPTISFVKQIGSATYANAATASSVTITIPAGGVATGDTVIITAGNSGNDGVTVSSAIDSRGNSYTVDANKSQISYFENTAIVSGYIATALQAGDTITVTYSGQASIMSALASEWSGIASSGRVDRTANKIATTNALDSGTTATTTQAAELVIGSFIANGNTTFTAGSGYTPFATQFYNHVGSHIP